MKTIEQMKAERQEALWLAEQACLCYAVELDVGDERTAAFEVYEKVRNVTRAQQ